MVALEINLVLVLSASCAFGVERNKIYMRRAKMQDQATAATGYIYSSDSQGPASYVQFADTSGNLARLGYPPVTVGRFEEITPLHQTTHFTNPIQYYPQSRWGYHLNSYANPGDDLANEALDTEYLNKGIEAVDKEALKYEFSDGKDFSSTQDYVRGQGTLNGKDFSSGQGILNGQDFSIGQGNLNGRGFSSAGQGALKGPDFLIEKGKEEFIKEGGEKYDESKNSRSGEKGESGYKQIQEYDKGSKGKYGKEQHQGYNNEKGGNKEAHHDSGKHYASKHASEEKFEGASAGKSSHSKKGSKTTGYHKVFHKDEYKKDHSFYDEADNRGHFNKYGKHDEHKSSQDGAYKKGGQAEAAHQEKEQGKTGHYDKGHFVEKDSGFKGSEGDNKYYQNHAEYEKDGGNKDAKSYGYSDGNKY